MTQARCWWKEALLTMGLVGMIGVVGYGGYKGGEALVEKGKGVLRSIPTYDLNRWFLSNTAAFETPANNNTVSAAAYTFDA